MQPSKTGLAALIALLMAFEATAQSTTPTRPQAQPPESTANSPQSPAPASPNQTAATPRTADDPPTSTAKPDSTSAAPSNPTPLVGTEYFVTLPKGHGAHKFAAAASQAAGVPIYVVREVDAKHALLAIDQFGVANQLERKLRKYGLTVQQQPSKTPAVMGRTAPPELLVTFAHLKTKASKMLVLDRALANIANADTSKKTAAYKAFAAKIHETTSVPIKALPGQEAYSIILLLSGEALGIKLSSKIASFKGARAEPVQLLHPFTKLN